jgi:DNA repair exonuclease SbcCD ATPase subunit
MKERETYQHKFRKTIVIYMDSYLQENPQLEQTDNKQYKIALAILDHTRNMKITPMLLWSKINDIDDKLPRPFYHLFQNRLGSLLRKLLEDYPAYKLNLYFMQEQFELMQRTEATHSGEVLELRAQARTMQQQLNNFAEKLTQLNKENLELKRLNQQLSEENLHLKEQLESVLSSSDNHQQVAVTLRHNLTDEIHQLRDAEQQYKDKVSTLTQEKSNLFETCHQLTVENTDLKDKNKKLVEINTRLLKEKLDLIRIQQKQPTHDIEMTTQPGIGFFKK